MNAASQNAPTPLVVTGASGFVGRAFLARLAQRTPASDVLALVRSPASVVHQDWWQPHWVAREWDPTHGVVSGAWPDRATVVHLAAATGTATPAEMFAVNLDGTLAALDTAERERSQHFVFVSSIAATYADQRWYPYAHSKREAERRVEAGPVPWTIVRPTMVFGASSPVQRALGQLARLPVLPGAGRVQTQPVHVDDVAEALLSIVAAPPLRRAVEIGGPTTIAMRELLDLIASPTSPRARARLRLPLGPLRACLALAERLVPRVPVRAGQFAVFVNDSVAHHPPQTNLFVPQVSLAQMVR